jgi:hypothetical protein
MPKKLTMARLAAHDFNRSLRIWKNIIPPADILKSLVVQRERALAAALRNFGLTIILTLWLLANKSELSLKIAAIEISVPIWYVNFALSLILFGFWVQLVNYFVLNDFVRIASVKLFKFDTSWALTVLQDGAAAWSIGWITQYRFFSSSAAHRIVGRMVLYLVNLPFVVILGFAYWIILSVGFQIMHKEDVVSAAALFTVTAWLLVICPMIYLIVIRIPFTFRKNVTFIRWLFLYRLYRRMGLMPPRVDQWLSKRSP